MGRQGGNFASHTGAAFPVVAVQAEMSSTAACQQTARTKAANFMACHCTAGQQNTVHTLSASALQPLTI